MEQWKPVFGYAGIYEISDQGRIKRIGHSRGAQPGHIKRLETSPNGYLKVDLYQGCIRQAFYVHRLVAIAFLGIPPPGVEINHKNGIKTDNQPGNLQWVRRSENALHALATGTDTCYR